MGNFILDDIDRNHPFTAGRRSHAFLSIANQLGLAEELYGGGWENF